MSFKEVYEGMKVVHYQNGKAEYLWSGCYSAKRRDDGLSSEWNHFVLQFSLYTGFTFFVSRMAMPTPALNFCLC